MIQRLRTLLMVLLGPAIVLGALPSAAAASYQAGDARTAPAPSSPPPVFSAEGQAATGAGSEHALAFKNTIHPIHPSGSGPATAVPIGLLEPAGRLYAEEAQAGIRLASIELTWDQAEPGNGVYDESYFARVQGQIAAARAAGLSPVLSLGLQYTPGWVFDLDPASRYVDQYGDVWSDSPASGQGVANLVFSPALRAAAASYIDKVFAEVGTDFAAVRWGGGLPYDEVRYPDCPAGRTNCYWAFDANARSLNPVPGYIPGRGDPSQAGVFLNWYLSSIQNYIRWGLGVIRSAYSGEIDVLLPSWGIRPGDIPSAVQANLDGTSSRTAEIARGLDWVNQLQAYAAYGNVVAWSTWANRQDDWTDPQSWSPVHYISSILPSTVRLGGENTFGRATFSDVLDVLNNVRAYHLVRVMWMNESLTQQPGNSSIEQIAQAFSG